MTAQPIASPTPARRRRWKPVLLVLVVLALVLWLGRLGLHAYHYVETDDAYLTGRLHQIGPQLEGQVKAVLVQDNEAVQAGEVLVQLDPLEFEIAVQKAAAALAQAKAQETQAASAATQAAAQIAEARARVAQAGAGVVSAQAQLDLAKLSAGRNDQLLRNGGAVTEADVDNTRSVLHAAEAALESARANRTAAEAAVGSAQAAQQSALAQSTAAAASTAAAEAALRDTQRRLGYATLTAPAAGRVGNKSVEAGNHVLPGQILLSLAEPAPWIVANFKETQLARLSAGQDVDVTIDAVPGPVLHGRVESLSPASGAQFALLPPDNATGNFNKVVQRVPVKITLEPASLAQLGDRLRFGYSVIVSVRVR